MANFIETEKEASKGGFQGIKTVRGLVKAVELSDPPEGWKTTKDQIKVSLVDAAVLEMDDPKEEVFELREGKFDFYYGYAEKGRKPTTGSPYIVVLVRSAAKIGKKPSELVGTVQTFSKIPVKAFPLAKNKRENPDVEEWVTFDGYFSVIADEGADSNATKTYIKDLVKGLNKSAALRALIVDERAKQFPEFKEALNNGSLADLVGLKLVDDKFVEEG